MTGSRYMNTGGRHYGNMINAGRDYTGRDSAGRDFAGRAGLTTHVFAAARDHIDALGPDTTGLRECVTGIEAQVARGDDADGAAIARALLTIAAPAPELAATLAAGLLDPTVGVAAAVQSAARWALNQPPLAPRN